MSILVGPRTRVIIQGISGRYAQAQTRQMMRYGTEVVAGVKPGRGGEMILGIPAFDTVSEAAEETDANTSIVYVGAPYVKEAALEAFMAGLTLVMIAAEYVPVHDSMTLKAVSRERGTWVIGPNTVGLISPRERVLLGTLLPESCFPGNVGVVSRSGTLAIEVTRLLAKSHLGQSTCVAVGGDLVVGRNPADYLREFERDPGTDLVVLVGEVGGLKEYEAAEVIETMDKKVVAYVPGQAAPPGKRLGHVGAIIVGAKDRAAPKRQALEAAGAVVADRLVEIPSLVASFLEGRCRGA